MFLGWLLLLPLLSVHEAAHALAAYYLGDRTAKDEGRISLNPLAHIDLWGTLILPLFLSLSGSGLMLGWAKPVPVSPWAFQNPRRDQALVALSGPVSNILTAVVLALLFRVFGFGLLALLCQMSLTLAVFNLLPVAPLDGFKVVSGFLPFDLSVQWESLERWGIYLLLILMLTPVFNTVLYVPVAFLMRLLLGFV